MRIFYLLHWYQVITKKSTATPARSQEQSFLRVPNYSRKLSSRELPGNIKRFKKTLALHDTAGSPSPSQRCCCYQRNVFLALFSMRECTNFSCSQVESNNFERRGQPYKRDRNDSTARKRVGAHSNNVSLMAYAISDGERNSSFLFVMNIYSCTFCSNRCNKYVTTTFVQSHGKNVTV